MSDGPETQRLTHAEQRELGKQSPLDERTLEAVRTRIGKTNQKYGGGSYGDGLETAIEIVDEMINDLRQGRCR